MIQEMYDGICWFTNYNDKWRTLRYHFIGNVFFEKLFKNANTVGDGSESDPYYIDFDSEIFDNYLRYLRNNKQGMIQQRIIFFHIYLDNGLLDPPEKNDIVTVSVCSKKFTTTKRILSNCDYFRGAFGTGLWNGKDFIDRSKSVFKIILKNLSLFATKKIIPEEDIDFFQTPKNPYEQECTVMKNIYEIMKADYLDKDFYGDFLMFSILRELNQYVRNLLKYFHPKLENYKNGIRPFELGYTCEKKISYVVDNGFFDVDNLYDWNRSNIHKFINYIEREFNKKININCMEEDLRHLLKFKLSRDYHILITNTKIYVIKFEKSKMNTRAINKIGIIIFVNPFIITANEYIECKNNMRNYDHLRNVEGDEGGSVAKDELDGSDSGDSDESDGSGYDDNDEYTNEFD
jgi:hypothetical protein